MDELTGTCCNPKLVFLPDLIFVSSSRAAELFLLRLPKLWLLLLCGEASCASMLPFERKEDAQGSMLSAVLLLESILKELSISCNADGFGELEEVLEFAGCPRRSLFVKETAKPSSGQGLC